MECEVTLVEIRPWARNPAQNEGKSKSAQDHHPEHLPPDPAHLETPDVGVQAEAS